MDEDNYIPDSDLNLIRQWDYRDVFNLIDFLFDRWNYKESGFIKEWFYNGLFKRYELHLKLRTGGWSGNEELIEALLENRFICMLWYDSWQRGGHYGFEINPINIGFRLVSDYCKKNKVSRQYVHKIKNRFEWIIVSKNIRFIRIKRGL